MMTYKKLLWLLPLTLIFTGCSKYYVLSTASQPREYYPRKQRVIGVEKVVVPKYLYKREIAVAKSSSEVDFLSSGVWAEDLDQGLTQRLIAFLQKKFNQPNVYAYPWGLDKNPTIKVKLQITRFIAQDDNVYLDANVRVVNMKRHSQKARLFNIVVPTKSDAQSIVSAMDKAFAKLEKEIAKDLNVDS
ncbi:MAG: PqiC family protein [Sulfurovum sp.]|nr:PqiC family protein [Sulfurovum sp.]